VDNIVAALEHNDRIYQLNLVDILESQFEKVLAALQRPFPTLIRLGLKPKDSSRFILTSFLGGSAPHLQKLYLENIPFPGLPNLLLSATHLVRLDLCRIPNSGYFSPEAMVTALSTLTRLETLIIKFEFLLVHPDLKGGHQTSLKRTLLPVLTELSFKGFDEYLEDLVAWLDTPLLDKLSIAFDCLWKSETPQITQFISRAPKLKAYNKAHVAISDWDVLVSFPQTFGEALELRIRCNQLDSQLLTLARVCSSSFLQSFIPAVERLYILDHWITLYKIIGHGPWLELYVRLQQ
jgi:hypothetical protein